MALSKLTGTLVWNPSAMTLSVMEQAKIISTGKEVAGLVDTAPEYVEGGGLAPGKRGLCLAGAEREAETALRAAARIRFRTEKARILDQMRARRSHPVGVKGINSREGTAGLGEGAPNVRFVMIGSSNQVEVRRQGNKIIVAAQ